ncbi:MAG TPA: ABC transporter permease [Acholeplasma sp.]|jgi:ABC-type uncharacterized transport system permease subunit
MSTLMNRIGLVFKRAWHKVLKPFLKKTTPALIAIGIGLFLGFIIMLIFNPRSAFSGMVTLLTSGFSSLRSMGNVLYSSAPIILTGLSVALAFKTGLFNIGASGQMMVGSFTAMLIGVYMRDVPFVWGLATLGAILAGALWAFIPGLMKAFANVNEVVTSIMMNYIAAYLFSMVIDELLENSSKPQYSQPMPVGSQLPSLAAIFPNSNVNIGIFIAIAAAITIHILIHKTTLGYQLKASGFSMSGSTYAGMNTKANIVIAMVLAGSLAGLAGAVSSLAPNIDYSTSFAIFAEGYDGISVSLIGLGEPIGTIFAGLFMGYIKEGTFLVQRFNFDENIMRIIQGIIIYSIAASVAIQVGFKKFVGVFKKKDQSITPNSKGDEA